MNFEYLLKRFIEKRNELKKNTFIAITGNSGEGKSYAALRLAEIIDEKFDPEKQVVYTPKHMLQRIEEARRENYKVLILDEAHVTIPARTWFSLTNLAINFIMSTFRQLHRLVLIIVTPSLEEIDISVRRMINYYFIVERHNNRFSIIIPYEIRINRIRIEKQNVYLKRLIILIDRKPYRIKLIRLKRPGKETARKYEEVSQKFKAGLLQRQLMEIETKLSKDDAESKKSIEEILAWLFENKRILASSFRRKRDGTIKLRKDMFKRMFKLSEEGLYDLEARLFEELKKQALI